MMQMRIRAFTLIELLVVITLIGILAFSVVGWTSTLKDGGDTVKCLANLRTITAGTLTWANDRNGMIWSREELGYSRYRMTNDPLGVPELIKDYVPNQNVWLCPAGRPSVRKFGNNYAWLPSASYDTQPIISIRDASETTLYYDGYIYSLPTLFGAHESPNMGPSALKAKFQVKPHGKNEKVNWAYMDGHIETR